MKAMNISQSTLSDSPKSQDMFPSPNNVLSGSIAVTKAKKINAIVKQFVT
jgi:hypothetical protein